MTYKTEVIEKCFWERWNPETKTLSKSVVTLREVQAAIREYNVRHKTQHSDANPANFAKDFWRNHKSANRNWPSSVLDAGYIGRQFQFEGNSFEFIPAGEGQLQAVDTALVPKHDETTKRVRIQSVSLPLASKRLGRTDEPWLIQVLIRLRVFETHLALSSQHRIVQLDHLQTNVKLRGAEIDALFLGISQAGDDELVEVIICCEAKSLRDDIVPHQILNGVKAAFGMKIKQDIIIPLAVKAIAPSEVFVVEFEPVHRAEVMTAERLQVATSAIYEFVPPIPGIGR